LATADNPDQERQWLEKTLQEWLDAQFIPEAINQTIAERATQIYVRQRLEGENDLGDLVIAIITEMRSFDFSKSFFGEFAIASLSPKGIANAVSDLLLESLGMESCCGK
jgi:hypothetical protein